MAISKELNEKYYLRCLEAYRGGVATKEQLEIWVKAGRITKEQLEEIVI